MRKGSFAEAAPPKTSKEVQMRPEDLVASSLPPPTKKTESLDTVRGVQVSKSKFRSWNTTPVPSPATPKAQRVVRTPSETRGFGVHSAWQTRKEADHLLSEPAEEDMDCTLSASASGVVS